jgi:ABC-type nitrate/sulfonate/bicarbonate transport system permease component
MTNVKHTLQKNIPLVFVTALLALTWELVSHLGWISPLIFPPPSKIFSYTLTSISNGEIFSALAITLMRLLAGFVAGFVPGILLGWAMTYSARLRYFIEPLVAALYPIPKLAIFPFIMFLFGIGEISKTIVVAMTVFFPILINTLAGVNQINPVYLQTAQNYGAGKLKTFATVIFPGSLPWVLAGARIAVNTGFTVLIAVELLNANSGLGVLIWFGWETLNTLKLYTALITIALLGIIINLIFNYLFSKYLPWHQQVHTG